MHPNAQIVLEFVRACNARDLARVMSFLAPSAFYHDIPMDPLEGNAAIRTAIEPFLAPATRVDREVHHWAVSDCGWVLSERTDRFELEPRRIEIRVMGSVRIEDGQIIAWRDHFDLGQLTPQMHG